MFLLEGWIVCIKPETLWVSAVEKKKNKLLSQKKPRETEGIKYVHFPGEKYPFFNHLQCADKPRWSYALIWGPSTRPA